MHFTKLMCLYMHVVKEKIRELNPDIYQPRKLDKLWPY